MNYFNYFTEIEDTFVRKRGKHIFISPLDWALIENWKERGVPLHVAVRGIEKTFESYAARPRGRSIKTLFYCREEVEAQFEEWLSSQVGANGKAEEEKPESKDNSQLPFPRESILNYLEKSTDRLTESKNGKGELSETLNRVCVRLKDLRDDFAGTQNPNAEQLEESLTHLEKIIDEALLKNVSAKWIEDERGVVEKELKVYRNKMDGEIYRQTFDNLLLKRLRERAHIPRLSLFYL